MAQLLDQNALRSLLAFANCQHLSTTLYYRQVIIMLQIFKIEGTIMYSTIISVFPHLGLPADMVVRFSKEWVASVK